jgi:vacuolar-type H+-ATPase subunit I/STV1
MAPNNNSKNKRATLNDSLLEIIREGGLRSQKNTEELEEQELFKKKFEQLQQVRYQEQVVFNQKEQQTQNQVKAIQQELKALAGSVKNLDKEVDKAVEQIPAHPGVYHLNFLEKLKQAVVLLKKHVEEASTWLELFNRKQAKKRGYWPQAQKLGTQFSQSSERYVATSVG